MKTSRLGIYSLVFLGIINNSSMFGAAVTTSSPALTTLPRLRPLLTIPQQYEKLNINLPPVIGITHPHTYAGARIMSSKESFALLLNQIIRQNTENSRQIAELRALLTNLVDPRLLFKSILISAVIPDYVFQAIMAAASKAGLFAAVTGGSYLAYNAIKDRFSKSKQVQPTNPTPPVSPKTSSPVDSVSQQQQKLLTIHRNFEPLKKEAHAQLGELTLQLDQCPPDSEQHAIISAQIAKTKQDIEVFNKLMDESRKQSAALVVQGARELVKETTSAPSLTTNSVQV